jgi:GntR family transcriptional regulator/MocR family aminotransferase
MQPALLFTTPSHQFPMGGLLTIGRRLELVDYARRTGCWLIEDDYDSEFRYDGTPLTSLQEIDPGRVIYIGTFSKILYPSLRLGYMVLPPSLVPMFREWKRLSDHHSNSVYQLALMRFIEDGELERHIRHMKRVYRKRRETLLEIIQQVFQGRCRIYGEAAGMHLVLELPGIDFTPELSDQIRSLGVYTVPVEEHALEKGRHCNQIILGYSHLSPGEMEQGLRRIRDGLKL